MDDRFVIVTGYLTDSYPMGELRVLFKVIGPFDKMQDAVDHARSNPEVAHRHWQIERLVGVDPIEPDF